MADTNILCEQLGIDGLSQEDQDGLDQVLESLAGPDTRAVKDKASDLQNVYYINFVPGKDKQSPELEKKLNDLKDNVGLNAEFLEIKANESVKSKIGNGLAANDAIGQANYKAKVVNYLAGASPWTAMFATNTFTKTFTDKKENFHGTLVDTFVDGLGVSPGVSDRLESVLTNISNTINSSDTATSTLDLTFFIIITVYQKDDVLKSWNSSFRTIYFKVNETITTYNKSKHDHSSGMNVNVQIDYAQADGDFNEQLFVQNAKAGINTLVTGKSGEIISKPVDVPV